MDIYEEFLARFGCLRRADDTKDPQECEQQDVEEHMTGHRDRPHSRDDAGVGLPAIWNRRKRVEQDDPDIIPTDPDMSVNYKSAAKNKGEKKEKKTRPAPTDVNYHIDRLLRRLGKVGPKFSEAFSKHVKTLSDQAKTDREKTSQRLTSYEQEISRTAEDFSGVLKNSKDISRTVAEAWSKTRNIFERAGVVEAIQKIALKAKLPESVKIPVMRSHGKKLEDMQAIKALFQSPVEGEKISALPEMEVGRFVALASAFSILLGNPDVVSPDQFKDKKLSERLTKQVKAVADLVEVTTEWQDALAGMTESGHIDISEGNWSAVLQKMDSFMRRPALEVDGGTYMTAVAEQMQEKYGEVPDEIASILKGYGAKFKGKESGNEPVKPEAPEIEEKTESEESTPKAEELEPPTSKLEEQGQGEKVQEAMKEYKRLRGERRRKKFEQDTKETPEAGSAKAEGKSSTSAASYEAAHRRMDRSAAYHGIVCQGHPTDPPGSSPKNYDKRYFGKEHYDSILASAKEFLNEDWLKYGWGENPGDVPVRAALDLAIGTADNGLYQSKIDAITYNMLLNRLAGWDYDIFNETLLAGPKARKASVMVRNSAAHAILKIADDMRLSHPDLSIQIIKNVHALMRTGGDQEQGQAFRQKAEKELETKLKSTLKDLGVPEGVEFDKLLGDILKGVDDLKKKSEPTAKPEGQAQVSSVQVLKAFIHVAHEKREYRKYLPLIVAAAKKTKKEKKEKKKAPPKEEEAPKPSVPEKKADKKKADKKKADKKKADKTSKKRKSSITLAASDINW
jgi:hypothetical protein